MKRILILPIILAAFILPSCDIEEAAPTQPDPNPVDSTTLIDSTLFEGLCIPPITTDTDEIKLQMKLNDNPYVPTANWACVIPNFFLGFDQIWINGAIPPALKVVTLMVPNDIEPGTYTLQLNSPHDARYTPTDGNYFTVSAGTLTITVHDKVNKHIEGGFEFVAENLNAPTLPTVTFTEGCFQADY